MRRKKGDVTELSNKVSPLQRTASSLTMPPHQAEESNSGRALLSSLLQQVEDTSQVSNSPGTKAGPQHRSGHWSLLQVRSVSNTPWPQLLGMRQGRVETLSVSGQNPTSTKIHLKSTLLKD